MATSTSPPPPEVIQLILDTRTLWPEAKQTRDLLTCSGPSRALALLPPTERHNVLKYFFVRDAKMSLASQLLKHYIVGRCCPGVSWRETTITRDKRTKPVFVDPETGRQPVVFNVSHQAGLVALVAVAGYDANRGAAHGAAEAELGPGIDVGVDVVCVSERRIRDHGMVNEAGTSGWPRFVDLHADVFSPREAAHLKYTVLASKIPPFAPGTSEEEILDYKLRCFYTLWCLREAYVKMTGEALVAEWLTELEFKSFRPPPRPVIAGSEGLGGNGGLGGGGGAGAGEDPNGSEPELVATEHEVWFKGEKVDDANICLRSLGPDYMVCTAVRTPGRKEDGLAVRLGPFAFITMDELVEFAESRS